MDTRVKCNEVVDGLMPSEKIARIQTADGKVEDVAVAAQSIREANYWHLK